MNLKYFLSVCNLKIFSWEHGFIGCSFNSWASSWRGLSSIGSLLNFLEWNLKLWSNLVRDNLPFLTMSHLFLSSLNFFSVMLFQYGFVLRERVYHDYLHAKDYLAKQIHVFKNFSFFIHLFISEDPLLCWTGAISCHVGWRFQVLHTSDTSRLAFITFSSCCWNGRHFKQLIFGWITDVFRISFTIPWSPSFPACISVGLSHHPSETGQTGGYTYFERLASVSHGPREFWRETEELRNSFCHLSQFLPLLVTHSCCLLHLV